jgi:nucleoside phosphorylase
MSSTHISPMQNCDFGILTASEQELESLLRLVDQVEEERSGSDVVYHVRVLPPGTNDRHGLSGVVAPTAGVGRVEAAVAASNLLHAFSPHLLFLIGIAGGFPTNGVALGDLIVASRIVDYEEQRLTDDDQEFRLKVFRADDVLLAASKATENRDWYGQLRYPDGKLPTVHIGPILSGDKVIASEIVAASLLLQDPSLLGVEMEGSGVAMAASRARRFVRFLMIRGIVDLANDRKREDAQVWRDRTCEAVASFTLATLLQAHAADTGHDTASRNSGRSQRPGTIARMQGDDRH